jgi:CheY-like chemotaxis protein
MQPSPLPPILIVDDDPLFRSLTSMLLESRGLTVTTASGCQEALTLLATNGAGVAVVDMVMPEIDGIATIRKLRAASSDLVFVACSGHNAEEFETALRELQVREFIAKPFTIEELIARMERAMSRAAA